jgi:hypothetical protein
LAATSLACRSVAPPGGYATTMRTGFVGHDCALADIGAITEIAAARRVATARIMADLLFD